MTENISKVLNSYSPIINKTNKNNFFSNLKSFESENYKK